MRLLLTIALICLSVTLPAQAPREKWGNATQEELTMAFSSVDPSASAVILNNYGHYYFDRHYYFSAPELRTIYHYQVRLKVLSAEGKKYATISIPFRGFDEYENVVEISGTTYNLENGKVVKSKLKHKTIEWKRNGRDLWNCTFTLPDVKEGSVIEYSYKIASLDFVKLRDWMFQKEIPVLHSEMALTSPNYFQFAFFSNMPAGRLDAKRTEVTQHIQFYNTNIYTNSNKLQLTARNIPAFRKEVLMPDSSRSILKGEFLLSMAITRPVEFTRYNDYYVMPFLKPLLLTTTDDYYEPKERMRLYTELMTGYKIIEGMEWESFAKKLSKDEAFGKGMLKAIENKAIIDSFRKMEAGKKRMIAIYDYVKGNFKWNGEYRIFASNSMEKIFERKAGYSSDINMLLINLLSRSGIQARPVLISTRSYGSVYKELGFFRKFNHVIVSVEIEGQRYLLDATDPLRPYNLLSTEDLNGEGLLVNLLDFSWIPLENLTASTISQLEEIQVNSDGAYSTAITTGYTGFHSLNRRKELIHSSSNEKPEVENLQNIQLPLIVKSVQQNKADVSADSIVLRPLSANSLFENPFVEEIRTQAVDLKFEHSIVRELKIHIPVGYELVRYPAEQNLTMNGEFLSFTLKPEVENEVLKILFRVDVNNSFIPPQFYSDLKLLCELIAQAERGSIVLKKK